MFESGFAALAGDGACGCADVPRRNVTANAQMWTFRSFSGSRLG